MKLGSFGNRLTPALLTACVVLGIITALEWVALSGQDAAVTGDDARPTAADQAQLTRGSYTAPAFEAFSEIVERPLFTEGRSPPQEPVTEQASASPQKQMPLAMRLEGIALTPVARIAVLRDIPTNKLLRLAEGATHQGWVVERVNATSATLKRGEQTRELKLELDEKASGKKPSPSTQRRRRK